MALRRVGRGECVVEVQDDVEVVDVLLGPQAQTLGHHFAQLFEILVEHRFLLWPRKHRAPQRDDRCAFRCHVKHIEPPMWFLQIAGAAALLSTTCSVLEARQALLDALAEPDRRDETIVAAIDALEASQKFKGFSSPDFIDFAVAGRWRLDYATRRDRTSLSQSYVQVIDVVQELSILDGQGRVSTTVFWDIPATNDVGSLEICSNLQVYEEPRPHHLLNLDRHYLRPAHKLNVRPEDVANHVAASLPYELFHPHLTRLEPIYVDPELKLVRCTRPADDDDDDSGPPILTCQVWTRAGPPA